MARSTQARIFPYRLQHNVKQARLRAPESKLIACVKADGYGHGIATVAEALRSLVDGFAVACIEEALALRAAGIQLPVYLLEGPQTAEEIDVAADQGFVPCINEWHQLEWCETAPTGAFKQLWFKLDTGMHRLGFATDSCEAVVERLRPLVSDDTALVAFTHFASADDPANPSAMQQLKEFDAALEDFDFAESTANSAAILSLPASHRDWIRPGYMLYGGSPFESKSSATLDLLPAMEFTAEIISIRHVPRGDRVGYGGRWTAQRDSKIATIAVGYGDGYPRHAVDGTPVLINNERAPLAGRVSMDMITVDVTDHTTAEVGSAAILWGENPSIDEVARHSGTIGYELMAAMPPRVPRVVVGR